MCDSCHDDFVPFQVSVDAPTEVPVDEPFTISVTIYNEEMHAVYYPSVLLSVDDPDGLIVGSGDVEPQMYDEQGTLGFRDSDLYTFDIYPGAVGATFQLDGSGGFLDDLDLIVTSSDGLEWTSSETGLDESIELSAGDIASGGYGQYSVTVNHPSGVRRASYDLHIEIVYGSGSMMLFGPDDLQQDDSHTWEIELQGTAKGPNGVLVVVAGTCVHNHNNGEFHEEDYSLDEAVTFKVGERLVYGTPTDEDDDGAGGDPLAGGRYLGFVAAGLLAASILTSGTIKRFPRKGKVHCWISHAMAGTFLVHWTMLWIGPYGSTLGGIGTGSVLLVCIALLTLTGVRPDLLDKRVMGMPWRSLHRYVTYILVVVLVIHAVQNGTDLAFLRG
jgi:hypothetical protein